MTGAEPRAAGCLLVLLFAAARPIVGQTVTTAIVQGTVTGRDSVAIANAEVEVLNPSTGQFWRVRTSATGRYFFETVTIGGPYRVSVRAMGFTPVTKTGIVLNVGQRFIADFILQPAVAILPDVVVLSASDPAANHGRTGPAQVISESAVDQLPDLNRDVTDLVLMSPQANVAAPYGDIGIGGQNPRYTTYMIDGGQNTDLYFGGLVGRLGLQRSISPEAVAQVQVLVAPADVRNGDFAGGAVNIVTRSGTNEWHGTVFGFFQGSTLGGVDGAGASPLADYSTPAIGLTLGGPIVKNELQLFVNADLQRRVDPDVGPFVTRSDGSADSNIGIRYQSIARFDSILSHVYGYATGGSGRSDSRVPASDLFAKLSAQAGANDQFELSDHFQRTASVAGPGRGFGYYGLGSMTTEYDVTENALQLIWRSVQGGKWSNELSVGYLWSQQANPGDQRTVIDVAADRGAMQASPYNAGGYLSQLITTTAEFTDNATIGLGSHVVTLGTHDELLGFHDNQFLFSGGEWQFNSLDSLARGLPSFYDIRLPGPDAPSGPTANFPVVQLGLYAQDQWALTREMMLTYGLRMDVPFIPQSGVLNTALRDSLGLETGQFPSGHPLLSPRVGVNYDVGGRGMTFLRGSVGLFTGQPAYRWFANGYHDSGAEQLRLTCEGSDVPAFDPYHPPTACGTSAEAVPVITVFDRDLKYPQNWKFSLGVDQRLPWGIVATGDLLYTYWVNQLYFSDANLTGPTGVAAGEGGRLMYGTMDANGNGTPSRINPAFGPVVLVSNRSGDRAFVASVQLQRQFGSGFGLSASYTYSHAEDAFSLSRFNSPSILSDTPLEGTVADRRVTTSLYNVPQRVSIMASVGLPLGARFSLIYEGSSQSPYTFVVSGDVNADGINAGGEEYGLSGQDIAYIPRDVRPGGDIELVSLDASGALVPANAAEYKKLDAYISGIPCLNRQRGQILARNSCSDPWFSQINARFAVHLPAVRGQSMQLMLDVINVPALLHLPAFSPLWTTNYRSIAGGEPTVTLLQLEGYDTATQRGIYSLVTPPPTLVPQQWNMQLGVRYSF